MIRHILIPTDGSDIATKAVTEGTRFARGIHAQVTYASVIEPFASIGTRDHAFQGMPESVRKTALAYLDSSARSSLDRAMNVAAAEGVVADKVLIEADDAYQAIIAEADARGADLIMMGSHGRGGVRGLVLGSVTQKVLTHTKTPVIVVR